MFMIFDFFRDKCLMIVDGLQQHGNVPESESILHVNLKKRFLQNLHVSDNAACELKNSAQTGFDSGGPSTTSRPTSG